MKEFIRTIIIAAAIIAPAALLSLPGLSLAENWTIDPVHSTASFRVKHMMISDVSGSFRDIRGTLVLDRENIEKSQVDVTMAATSIDTGMQKRDDHLRSSDFFDVATYPNLTFTSKQVKEVSGNQFTLVGDLTIHGVTRKVELQVTGPTAEAKDPWGNIRTAAKATARINRKDFGLTWNSALETGGVLVGEDVLIELDVQFIKQNS